MNKILPLSLIVLVVLVGVGLYLKTASRPVTTPTESPETSISPVALPVVSQSPHITTKPFPSPTPTPKATSSIQVIQRQVTPTPTPVPGEIQTHQVTIQNFTFSPSNLTVHKGDMVIFTNKDSSPHTATDIGGAWDSGSISSQPFTLDTANLQSKTYSYKCSFHPSMTGTLKVE